MGPTWVHAVAAVACLEKCEGYFLIAVDSEAVVVASKVVSVIPTATIMGAEQVTVAAHISVVVAEADCLAVDWAVAAVALETLAETYLEKFVHWAIALHTMAVDCWEVCADSPVA